MNWFGAGPRARSFFLCFFLAAAAALPAMAGDLALGRAKAEMSCQTCHGLDGIATVPMAANLAGQQKLYLVAQLEAYRAGWRRHEQMNIIARQLSDEDIENLAEWYAAIRITVEMPE